MNLKILSGPIYICSHTSSSSDLPYYIKIYLMHGNTLLLSDYFDLIFWHWLLRATEQVCYDLQFTDKETEVWTCQDHRAWNWQVMWFIVRFFTAKTHVSPTELVSFIQFWGLLFISEEERQRKGWGHNWKQDAEMLISSWLISWSLWFSTTFSMRTNFSSVKFIILLYR